MRGAKADALAQTLSPSEGWMARRAIPDRYSRSAFIHYFYESINPALTTLQFRATFINRLQLNGQLLRVTPTA